MLHLVSQMSNRRKIKNFFEHHRQDDGKNLKKTYKNLQKIATVKQTVAISTFCVSKHSIP